ncbi:MAG TPA: translation initiation factor IF-2, partial [Candidatus Aenigmarchaeota archaeon]|nr:translation initiation factor IF-2 [Candidatus Aenigmarchaeota archaeon]
DRLKRVLLSFNVKIPTEIKTLAKDLGVNIFENRIIYRLIEDYKKWCKEEKEREIRERLEKLPRPAEIRIIPGTIFRASHPAIFGVEILRGTLKPGVLMKRKDGKIIGRIKEIQKEGKTLTEARKGDKVAVSMEEPTVGRQIKEGDILYSSLSKKDVEELKRIESYLSEDEKNLLSEL